MAVVKRPSLAAKRAAAAIAVGVGLVLVIAGLSTAVTGREAQDLPAQSRILLISKFL